MRRALCRGYIAANEKGATRWAKVRTRGAPPCRGTASGRAITALPLPPQMEEGWQEMEEAAKTLDRAAASARQRSMQPGVTPEDMEVAAREAQELEKLAGELRERV